MEIYKGYIKGTNRKDSKIIEFFESKGGINSNKLEGSGGALYIIQKDKTISETDGQDMESYYNAQQEFEDWLNGKTTIVEKPTLKCYKGQKGLKKYFQSLGCKNILAECNSPNCYYFVDNNNQVDYQFKGNLVEEKRDTHNLAFIDEVPKETKLTETYPENRWWINKDINSLLFVKNPNITTGVNPGFWRGEYNKSWSFNKSMTQGKNWRLATDDEVLQRWEDYLVELNIEKGDAVTGAMFTTSAYTWKGTKLRMASENKGSIDTFDGYVFLTTTGETIKLVSKAVKETPKEPEINQHLLERNGYHVGDYIFVDYHETSSSWVAKISQLDLDSDSSSLRCGVSARLDVRDKNIENRSCKICYYATGQNRTVRHATPEEKGWLDYCIEQGAYRPLEEYQRVVKIEANSIQPTDDKFYVICYDVRGKGPYFIKDKCYLASNSSDRTMFRLEEDGEIPSGDTKPTWKSKECKSYESSNYSFRKATPQEVHQSFTRFGKSNVSGGRPSMKEIFSSSVLFSPPRGRYQSGIDPYNFSRIERMLNGADSELQGEISFRTQPKLVNKITKFDKESYKKDLEDLEKTTKVAVKFTKINAIPPKIKIINN